jgi:hypothetical protein
VQCHARVPSHTRAPPHTRMHTVHARTCTRRDTHAPNSAGHRTKSGAVPVVAQHGALAPHQHQLHQRSLSLQHASLLSPPPAAPLSRAQHGSFRASKYVSPTKSGMLPHAHHAPGAGSAAAAVTTTSASAAATATRAPSCDVDAVARPQLSRLSSLSRDRRAMDTAAAAVAAHPSSREGATEQEGGREREAPLGGWGAGRPSASSQPGMPVLIAPASHASGGNGGPDSPAPGTPSTQSGPSGLPPRSPATSGPYGGPLARTPTGSARKGLGLAVGSSGNGNLAGGAGTQQQLYPGSPGTPNTAGGAVAQPAAVDMPGGRARRLSLVFDEVGGGGGGGGGGFAGFTRTLPVPCVGPRCVDGGGGGGIRACARPRKAQPCVCMFGGGGGRACTHACARALAVSTDRACALHCAALRALSHTHTRSHLTRVAGRAGLPVSAHQRARARAAEPARQRFPDIIAGGRRGAHCTGLPARINRQRRCGGRNQRARDLARPLFVAAPVADLQQRRAGRGSGGRLGGRRCVVSRSAVA